MNAKPLPDHVAGGEEWKAWPRKGEAHVQWGLRERQLTALCRTGAIPVWSCPDGSLRIEPEKLIERFGQPGAVTGRERDRPVLEQKSMRQPSQADFERDPMAAVMREFVLMVRSLFDANRDLLKQIVDPMNAILVSFKEREAAASLRIRELESGWLEVMDLRSELADASHERQLQLQRAAATDARRKELLDMLRPHLPELAANLTGGSLTAFVKKVPPELLDSLLESRVLPPELETQLQRLVSKKSTGATQPSNTTNGAASHGHS